MPAEDKTKIVQTTFTKKSSGMFTDGHVKFPGSGRKKNSAQMARAIAESMGVDPIRFMLAILAKDFVRTSVLEGGKKVQVDIPISLEMKIDCAKALIPYMYPRLLASQAEPDEAPPSSTISLVATLTSPEMIAAAQTLSIALTTAEIEAREAEGTPAKDAPDPPKFKGSWKS